MMWIKQNIQTRIILLTLTNVGAKYCLQVSKHECLTCVYTCAYCLYAISHHYVQKCMQESWERGAQCLISFKTHALKNQACACDTTAQNSFHERKNILAREPFYSLSAHDIRKRKSILARDHFCCVSTNVVKNYILVTL